jgi:hypothetical protein
MSVAFDAASESHSGSSGSVNQSSFNWSHTPVGTPKGVLVFTFSTSSSSDNATSVSYGASSMTAVSGGRAVSTGGTYVGDCKAWFLGSSVPTGSQTITVNRTNNSDEMYAVAITLTAGGDTSVHNSPVLIETSGSNLGLAEQSVTDGQSSGSNNSLRFAAINCSAETVTTTYNGFSLGDEVSVGSNSTHVHSIDFSGYANMVVRETNAGIGSRSIGFDYSEASLDVESLAAVHLAVKEVIPSSTTYNETTSGGSVVSGASVYSSSFLQTASGGASLNGTLNLAFINAITMYGGVSSSGTIVITTNQTADSEGGAAIGGAAIVSGSMEYMEGGITVSGEASISTSLEASTDGGIVLSGENSNTIICYELMSGGCQLSGIASSDSSFYMDGGITLGSVAEVTFTQTIAVSGGVNAAPDKTVTYNYNPVILSSGVFGSGVGFVQQIIVMSGGSSVSGGIELSTGFSPSGGSQVAGVAENTASLNEPRFNEVTKGALGLGIASHSQQRIIPQYLAEGSITIEGSSDAGIKSIAYTASGGISLEDTEPVKANFVFNSDTAFKWKLNAYVIKDTVFLWNLGQLTMFWYRVVGKGTQDPCLPQDPCCQKFILNVHARSLSELCQKLSQRRYKFPIDFVQRFSRPAENTVVASDEASGINHDCNNLIDVEVCNIPECADFCVDQDVLQPIGFSISIQVNAFQEYEAAGNITISGFANATFTKNLPEYNVTSAGSLSIAGEAEAHPDHFSMRGGSSLGGSARLACSRWSFSGGEWPIQTASIFATESASVSQTLVEQPWSLTDRILSDNGLYSSTDISYSKSSQGLLAKNFGLNLPSWANILQVVIAIDRKSSSTSIRDKEIYLMLGDQQLSENLAVTDTSWPLIETKKYYVLNVGTYDNWRNPIFESQVPPQKIWELENISVEDLNDPDFGVVLKIKNIANVKAIARVDYINIQVTYEDETGSIIRMSSGIIAKSPSYSWQSSGRVNLSSQTIVQPRRNFEQTILSAGARLSGSSYFTYDIEANGGLHLAGESLVTPYIEEPQGGCLLNSIEALINPAWYTMAGGVGLYSSADVDVVYNITTSGLVVMNGLSIVTADQFFHTASGSLSIAGNARARTPNRSFSSDGNVVFVEGEADIIVGDFELEDENIGFDMSVSNITASFLTDVELNNLSGLTDNLTKCGCYNLPLTIQLYHNFATSNSFAKFLVRNGLTINRTLSLRYNEINDSWQNNLHYKGFAFNNNSYESWDIISELNCTSNIGGIVLGTSVWRLALQFFRRNLTTGAMYDSRILIAIIPDNICRSTTSQLDFLVEYNTQSRLATATPNATIYQSTLYDNIGLFKNPAWVDNPILRLKVSQSGTIRNQPRLDLTSTVLS